MRSKKSYDHLNTILVVTVGFLVLFFITNWTGAIYVSTVVGLLGLFSKAIAQRISFGWFKLAAFLNLIIPNILLSIIFFMILTPIALLSRIGKRNTFHLKNVDESLFIQKKKTFHKNDFEKPW